MRLAVVLGVLALLGGCGSGPRARVATASDSGDFEEAWDAYEEFRHTEGEDADLLARVAGVLLREEARSDDPERRRSALAQLALAGTAGEPILQEIADSPGLTPARLGALERLARRGNQDARLALRALADTDDPAVLTAAILGMDPSMDRELLLGHLGAEEASVRTAAASALAGVAEREDVRAALSEASRVDPEASVRAAAVRSLARGGADAVASLRERLGDPEPTVRLAAVGALFAADRADALEALAPLLEVDPSPAGLEAARLIAQLDSDEQGSAEAANARAFLTRALASDDPAVRSQAGVALAGLPLDAASPLAAVRDALASEVDATVQLSLARALWRRDRETAERSLEALLTSDAEMPRVQAAAILAGESHEDAPAVLEAVLDDADASSVSRRTAARALAREAGRPLELRLTLRDRDALVRIYAAGGILASAAART